MICSPMRCCYSSVASTTGSPSRSIAAVSTTGDCRGRRIEDAEDLTRGIGDLKIAEEKYCAGSTQCRRTAPPHNVEKGSTIDLDRWSAASDCDTTASARTPAVVWLGRGRRRRQ